MNAPVAYHIPKPRLFLVHDARKVAPNRDTWRDVHRRISRLGKDRAAHEHELCRGLLEAERLGVHARLGFASLKEYAERMVGLSARQCEERLRVGRALEQLPKLKRALAGGELCWSVVRELTRVATRDNESAWLDWARGRRASEVAAAVAERKTGAEPESPAERGLVRHRLSFEVRAETMALFRELQATVRRDLGAGSGIGGGVGNGIGNGTSDQAIDDDTLLFEIARRALAGGPRPEASDEPPHGGAVAAPNDETASVHSASQLNDERVGADEPPHEGTVDAGRPHYQLAVTRCPSCGDTNIEAGGRSHRVEPEVAEMIDCDAQVIRVETPAKGTETRSRQGAGRKKSPSPQRATQTIPPATRRAIIRRHHGRCAVPGCRHHQFLDIHHVTPRSEGGPHDPNNLIALCGAHHRAHHRGQLRVTGNADAGFRFFHADGTPYGRTLDPAKLETARRVIVALTGLGFRRKEAEDRLRRVQHARSVDVDSGADAHADADANPEADFESLLRAALTV